MGKYDDDDDDDEQGGGETTVRVETGETKRVFRTRTRTWTWTSFRRRFSCCG